jgi:hypothetical protein
MWSQQSLAANASENAGPGMRPSLLGLSMRICEPEFALENVWHVLDVLEGSPAESAGLVPYGDWIIGWSGGVLGAESDFYDVVEAVSRPFTMTVHALILRSISTSLSVSTSTRMTLSMSYDSYVSSSDNISTIREVVLVPNRQWGGEGLLGCVFG